MKEPKFIPKPGQVDYTGIRYAPVVNIVVTNVDRVLLVKRSSGLRLYPSYWNGVSGFLDTKASIEDKVYEELREELNIPKSHIVSVKIGDVFVQEAEEYQKTWIVFPINAVVSSKTLKLNWENTEAKWFDASEIKTLKLLPGFEKVVKQFVKI